jgi:AraC family transcriptional regulator
MQPANCGAGVTEGVKINTQKDVDAMLQTVAQVSARSCQFEVLSGEWPKPVELPWSGPDPILAMMFREPDFHSEGRYAGWSVGSFMSIGNIFMTLPNNELIGKGTGGKIRIARCIYSRNALAELIGGKFEFDQRQQERALNVGNASNGMLMRKLMQEVLSPGFASEMLVESVASALLIDAVRHIIGDNTEHDVAGDRAALSARHLKKVDDYLDGLDEGVPQVSELARLCGFSTHYFAKLFRRTTGQRLSSYLAGWRMERAKFLLLQTDLPLKEVAFRLGFTNAANFSTAFSKDMEVPPGQFRRLQGSRKMGKLEAGRRPARRLSEYC